MATATNGRAASPASDQELGCSVSVDEGSGSRVESNYKYGDVPHGYFRKTSEDGDIELFCCFVNGHQHGPAWKGLIGGGFLVSPSLEFTSADTVFLYPDCRTALVGRFSSGVMVEAFLADVVGMAEHCGINCGMFAPRIGNVVETQPYSFDLSTSDRLSLHPLLPDPYERYFCLVTTSRITSAGDGVFSRVDVLEGTIVAFYNGVRSHARNEEAADDDPSDSSDDSSSSSDEEDGDDFDRDKDAYRVSLVEEVDLDIPMRNRSSRCYKASVGHKVNSSLHSILRCLNPFVIPKQLSHSFDANCEFDLFEHPRFGVIHCVVTLKDVAMNQELTVNYGYRVSTAPLW
jgi:histone-lysine N-methyltransferase SETD7